MKRHIKYIYPVLFAVVPVITLAADHIGQFYMSDLLVLVAASATVPLVTWLVFRAVPWKGDRSATAALIALFGVFLLFYLFPLGEVMGRVTPDIRHRWIISALAVAGAVAFWWIGRSPALLARSTVFLALMGGFLFVQASVRLGVGMARGASFISNSTLVRDLAQPIQVAPPRAQDGGPKRDVFLVILDMYASDDVLLDVFGFDNRPFLDSLEALGFAVPQVRSNYTRTILSLASILNLDHVDRIADEVGPRSRDRSLGRYLTENNRAVTFLKSQGYRFHFYPPLWAGLTQRNRYADETFRPRRNLMESLLAKSSLNRRLWESTALGEFAVVTEDRTDVESVLRSFKNLGSTPDYDEPLFVFAHFFVPHNPFILDENCDPAGRRSGDERGRERATYIGQVECVNRQVLEFLPPLLERSPAPIILLQADHGTRTIREFDPERDERVPFRQAKERHGAFGAYYLPGAEAVVPDSITTVNLLRYVFAHYFGADLPPVSDRLFYSDGDHEYLFFPVETEPDNR